MVVGCRLDVCCMVVGGGWMFVAWWLDVDWMVVAWWLEVVGCLLYVGCTGGCMVLWLHMVFEVLVVVQFQIDE